MTPEEVIAQWIERHPHISTPEWGAKNLICDLEQYGYGFWQFVYDEDDELEW